MGAWIEIFRSLGQDKKGMVAPYMGAWIEIRCRYRGRSLFYVAPYMGAWIEILIPRRTAKT